MRPTLWGFYGRHAHGGQCRGEPCGGPGWDMHTACSQQTAKVSQAARWNALQISDHVVDNMVGLQADLFFSRFPPAPMLGQFSPMFHPPCSGAPASGKAGKPPASPSKSGKGKQSSPAMGTANRAQAQKSNSLSLKERSERRRVILISVILISVILLGRSRGGRGSGS